MQDTHDLDSLIVDQMAEAVIHSNASGTIERWNRAACEMFGFSKEDALGQSLDLIIPEHLRAAHWRGFDAAIAAGKTRLNGRPTLTKGLHKSGQKLYVEMSFALVLDDKGKCVGSVAVARDATERVMQERAAFQQAKADA